MSKLPAVFPVPGGTVEVKMSGFGLKRCHYVTDEGREFQLDPDPDSAEGRRARLDRAHPALSRTIGLLSLCVLVAALAVLVPQLAEQLIDFQEQRLSTVFGGSWRSRGSGMSSSNDGYLLVPFSPKSAFLYLA
ncbi:hypothetical protein AB0H77_29650 [Streptomyces sp. NPDC050844]|uniref:hypothetical protein n=1 Tax=Streptomyces sp. NPDC050844 TaxID=3155790 RepID=UPI0033CC8F5F